MRIKIILTGLVLLASGAGSSGEALAWGCTAVASDGAYGYSYDWPDEQDAELTALKECDKRTKSGDCQTDQCDPNG